MKFSRGLAALAVCGLALVALAAQALGVDVHHFVAQHADVLGGLSMLAMAGEVEVTPGKIKEALDRIAEANRVKLGGFDNRLMELEQRSVREPGGDGAPIGPWGPETKELLGEQVTKAFGQGGAQKTERIPLGSSIKALVNPGSANSNNTVFPSQAERIPGFYGYVIPQLTLLDVLPSQPISAASFEFVQLGSTGDADVQEEEGDEKAAMEFEGDLETGKVSTIAVHTTASAQVLEDVDGLSTELQRIMTGKVRAKLQQQILLGSGVGNRINGLYTQAPLYTASASLPAERLGEAASVMDAAGYATNVIVMNPADWFSIITSKTSTGEYIYGNPQSPAQPTLWNKPVVLVPGMPAGRALVGNTAQVSLRDRMMPTVFISREHKDYLTRNLALILVELRMGMALYDRQAFRRVNLTETVSGGPG